MFIDHYSHGTLANDRWRELLHRAEEGRGVVIWEKHNSREKGWLPAPASDRLSRYRTPAQLGEDWARFIDSCCRELHNRGFSREEAMDLTKGLLADLHRRKRGRRRSPIGLRQSLVS